MKLNLGCGLDKRQGFINIDLRGEVKPDLVLDLNKLPYPYENDSIDEIIAKDILEHFPFKATEPLLKEWYRLLKKGGKIYIQTPDIEYIAKEVIMTKKYGYKETSFWIYGEQDYPTNFHKTGFTIPTIKILLETIGFKIDDIKNNGGTNLMCWASKL